MSWKEWGENPEAEETCASVRICQQPRRLRYERRCCESSMSSHGFAYIHSSFHGCNPRMKHRKTTTMLEYGSSLKVEENLSNGERLWSATAIETFGYQKLTSKFPCWGTLPATRHIRKHASRSIKAALSRPSSRSPHYRHRALLFLKEQQTGELWEYSGSKSKLQRAMRRLGCFAQNEQVTGFMGALRVTKKTCDGQRGDSRVIQSEWTGYRIHARSEGFKEAK